MNLLFSSIVSLSLLIQQTGVSEIVDSLAHSSLNSNPNDIEKNDMKQIVLRTIQSVKEANMNIDRRYPIMLEWISFFTKKIYYKLMIPIIA